MDAAAGELGRRLDHDLLGIPGSDDAGHREHAHGRFRQQPFGGGAREHRRERRRRIARALGPPAP